MAWIGNIFNFLAGGQYTTSPAPITPGSSGPLLCDQYGRLVVLTSPVGAPVNTGTTWVDPAIGTPLTYQRVVSATAKSLYLAFGMNEGTSDRWFMLFDSSALPSPGAQPTVAFKVPAGQPFSLEFTRPRAFLNGIAWNISSTAGTLTSDTAASFRAHFEVG